jgi:pimeloyl-ACP methyl ester carboxylesterase
LHRRLRAAALLLRMEGGKGAPGWLVHYGERPVEVAPFVLSSGAPALRYAPRGEPAGSAMLLAHGIHAEGIHEARLQALARALASSGVLVLTPELSDLTQYRVTHAGAEAIAEAARALARHSGRTRVDVFGISFGGGLALRAVCESGLRDAIARVIALGAHHDAAEVARFVLAEAAPGPNGERAAVTPHPYGARVLFQGLLGERHRGPLSDPERTRLEAALPARAAELRRASPVGCPQQPRVPLHLVHGLGDNIIPYTESLWNARQFAPATSVELLISAAIGHAEYGPISLWERLRLVDFMAQFLP